jgi:hypothetical protein
MHSNDENCCPTEAVLPVLPDSCIHDRRWKHPPVAEPANIPQLVLVQTDILAPSVIGMSGSRYAARDGRCSCWQQPRAVSDHEAKMNGIRVRLSTGVNNSQTSFAVRPIPIHCGPAPQLVDFSKPDPITSVCPSGISRQTSSKSSLGTRSKLIALP